MIWRWQKLLGVAGRRLMSTNGLSTNKQSEKVVESYLESISGDKGHALHGVAAQILRIKKDADDIRTLTAAAGTEKDPELEAMAKNDLELLNEQLGVLNQTFIVELVDSLRFDPVYQKCSEVTLEVSPGVGGQEAMLFSRELMDLYTAYANYKLWDLSVLSYDLTELGGLRHGSLLIKSPSAYKTLSLESGVHRVQRVPKTEKAGRIHTSTTTVSLLPSVSQQDVSLDEKDLKIETKRASGAGGQHVNTTDSAVRITHVPSGLVVECQTERNQLRNKTQAIKTLSNKLYKLEADKALKASKDLQKLQIGLRERSDKIRTYNYVQDRATDHRFSFSTFDLRGILEGGEVFDAFLKEINAREISRILSLL